eukprot:CAMPEP_0185482780 /NCGR_PEP_ID=MMETSP1366-20130426/8041_1 /TAXON_ID=38817 /ORGANISM="Gephyrocapsa oceanica, Strain RCC1303" /LENGTH=56 /DNA_ID=CAMNT_0028090643 /DNA_START=114 /DNA_END=281 /DNA_ORIENTATION=+
MARAGGDDESSPALLLLQHWLSATGLAEPLAALSSRSVVNGSTQPQAWPWGDFCVD